MRNWLSRLSFSFVIIAAVAVWEVYKMQRDGVAGQQQTRFILYCVLAGACAALAVAGFRARHRDGDRD
jgi:hypothetical protein